jgi:hypothetical protein
MRFWVMDDLVVLGEVAVDRRLHLDDRAEDPRLGRRWVSDEKKVSTALSHEPEVGVKTAPVRGLGTIVAGGAGSMGFNGNNSHSPPGGMVGDRPHDVRWRLG